MGGNEVRNVGGAAKAGNFQKLWLPKSVKVDHGIMSVDRRILDKCRTFGFSDGLFPLTLTPFQNNTRSARPVGISPGRGNAITARWLWSHLWPIDRGAPYLVTRKFRSVSDDDA